MVGFGAAAAEVVGDDRLAAEARAQRELTDRVALEAPARVGGVVRYGDPVDRVPHLVCLGVEGVEAEPILLGLDQRGVAVHSGSACSSEALEPSPILAAMGVDADHSLRVSVGWSSVTEDVDAFLDAFPDVVDRLRALRAG
jgi:cysteine desulfurase